jgi:hypothetical protein
MTDKDTRPRITTPFGFESTAAEVIEGIDLSGTRAIVTRSRPRTSPGT